MAKTYERRDQKKNPKKAKLAPVSKAKGKFKFDKEPE